MAERKRLGLIFTVNPNWMGGTYYILNLINSFNYLEDKTKPEIVLLCRDEKDYEYAKEYTDYPYLEYQIFYRKLTIIDRIANKFSRSILGYNIFTSYRKRDIQNIDVIYPVVSRDLLVKGVKNIGWIPDFQEKHLPELFPAHTIQSRDENTRRLRDSEIMIIFSSNDARNDYLRFFDASIDRTAIFKFSSKIPVVNSEDENVLNKYNVEQGKYLFCGNQFWIHKNHRILFKAIKYLKDKGYNPILLCTGNSKDNRAKEYFEDLKQYIDENQLQDNIRILGLIDRNDQLSLMKNGKAVIQPSLFEGWNTSIEEAKALNKFLIVSDLDVHKEQVTRNGVFFNRHSAEDLAEKIKEILNGNVKEEAYDYTDSIKESAETFMRIIDEECNKN